MQDLQRRLLKHISGHVYKHDCAAMGAGGGGVNATHTDKRFPVETHLSSAFPSEAIADTRSSSLSRSSSNTD